MQLAVVQRTALSSATFIASNWEPKLINWATFGEQIVLDDIRVHIAICVRSIVSNFPEREKMKL